MKGHDLARLLLSKSNKDVYITETNFSDWNEEPYYTPLLIEGLDESPEAIFLKSMRCEEVNKPVVPEQKPDLHSYKILLIDADTGEEVWYLPEDSHYYDFLSNIEYKYFYSYSYTDGESFGIDLGGLEKDYPDCEKTFYEDEILYVEVVTEVVDNGWTAVYSVFSLQEATDYFTKLHESLTSLDNEEKN